MEEAAVVQIIQNMEEAEEQANNPERDFWSHWTNINPFAISDRKFVKYFRLTKELVHNLIQELSEYLTPPTRRSALTVEMKAIALKFFASGSYQTDIGSFKFMGVSQSSVSRCVAEVINALNENQIFNRWVHFPATQEELNSVRREFYEKYGIPGIVGVIDCTHVAIYPPTRNGNHPEHIYVNRKNYHSINTQLVCDVNMKITNANARFPGSSHDAFIWNNSNINLFMQQINRHGETYFLIGDSGYPLRQWVQTPIRNPEPGAQEDAFNTAFKSCRTTIERCNGLLKMRFRCLLKHRVLHYTPNVASKIINACTILHNMCIANNIPDPANEEGDELLDFGVIMEENILHNERRERNAELENGRQLQQQLVRNFQ
ncbi:hypothetical protein RI129_002913 [Pyrocoelia pectoralis]|uniref:Putative nuclease HARBI1 n=1 Tax=Pyrocoelia pectoralis TaxID=417401 RepID=A0AAN7ZTX6_9COLE